MKNSLIEIDNELTDEFYQNREEYLAHLDEVIENQRKFFLKDLTIRTHRSTTDFKVKLMVKSYVSNINRSAKSLKSLKGNDAQRIIIERYSKSYRDTLTYMAQYYGDYFPQTEIEALTTIKNKKLEKHIFQDKLMKFKEVNSKAVEYGLVGFDNSGYFWMGKKNELVDFCRVLNSNSILNKNISLTNHIHFFEDFYNLNVGDQSKPSKFNKRSLDLNKFNHLLT
ncbi:hypothetical protein [Maribacter sp. HTCC2170]|uniref:hypothetical protein n=1 Tax=Maribacter sp. (strain HTCC2170 / KCCM 42371) TaxID=313603 RepID=UPI00006BD34B|nr:hypothetical protein [Maribacter sp. HTCC2170]EAR02020.1 hypothetical protein FB2170_02015 [Maribacter sp. HTCC2170]